MVQLYYHTLRHVTPRQVANRAARVVRRKSPLWRPSARPALELSAAGANPMPGWVLARDPGRWSQEYEAAVAAGARLIEREFTFIGRAEALRDRQLPWNDSRLSQLWRFHLHYFDFIFELAAYGSPGPDQRARAAIAFADLASDWIARNPFGRGDGWHPYTVSRRLPNWIMASHVFAAEFSSSGFDQVLLASISQQARYLARNLEFDVRGNHLVANLRALICCGVFLAGAEPARWKRASLEHLRLEVAEQVLPDGGHFERNPGYHLAVLRDLLEIASWCAGSNQQQLGWLTPALERMLDYLVGVLPPSGELPLLKDTAWDEIPEPRGILAMGCVLLGDRRWKRFAEFPLYAVVATGEDGWETFRRWEVDQTPFPSIAFPDTGHYILRDDSRGDFLIFDAGEPCPPYLPAHAHADLLSFELSVAGRRVVVDSGVYEYARGPWRDYFRSTRAHNTVEVLGQNQSEVWSSFRTARRARPRRVLWRPEAEGIMVAAEHDGYARLRSPVIHRRWILWRIGRFWLVVDRLNGSLLANFKSQVHIHNSLSLQPASELKWKIDGAPIPLWITVFGDVSVELVQGQLDPHKQGWQSERFGELKDNPVLVVSSSSPLPAVTGFALSLDEPVSLEYGGPTEPVVSITHMGRHHQHPLDN